MRTPHSGVARLTLALVAAAAPALAQPPGTRVSKDPAPTTAPDTSTRPSTSPTPTASPTPGAVTTTSPGETVPTAGAAGVDPAAANLVLSMRTDADAMGLLHASNVAEIQAGSLAQTRARDAEVRGFATRMVNDHTMLDQQGNTLASRLGVSPTLPDSTLPRLAEQEMSALQATTGASRTDSAGAMSDTPAAAASPTPTSPSPTTPSPTTPSPTTPSVTTPNPTSPTPTSITPMPQSPTSPNAAAAAAAGATPDDAAFDRAYIDQQVTDHARTLALVDAAIERAQNAELKTALQTQVRPHVAEHLQAARQLQQRLGSR